MPTVPWKIAVVAASIISCTSVVQGLCQAQKPRSTALTYPLGQCSGTLFIRTPAEAEELAVNCSVFDGNLYLSGGVGAFNLSGLTRIYGSLSSTGPDDMTQVSANDLRSIGGRLSIGNSRYLERLSFPALADVESLTLFELPKLTRFTPQTGRAGVELLQNVSTVWIRATGLSNLDWLAPLDPEKLTIIDNTNLSEVSIYGLWNSTARIEVGSNLTGFAVSFPNLRQARNLTLYGCASVDLPALELVNETLALVNNTVEELNLPRLREVQEDFVLRNNSEMASVKVPALDRVGRNVVFEDNAQLEAVNLPSLESIDGDLLANGSFTKLNFDSLNEVQGDVSIFSTGTLDCAPFAAYDQSNVFKTQFSCSASSDTGETPGKPASDGLTSGAKAGIAVGAVVGVALLASGAWLIWRKTRQSADHVENNGIQEWRKSELPADATTMEPPSVHAYGAAPVQGTLARSRSAAATELDPSRVRHELSS